MHSVRPAVVSRASNAFYSLAVTVAMAVLTILALAFGTVQDSKAETDPHSAPRNVAKVDQP